MANVIEETIGKLETMLGFDGSDFTALAVDTAGQAKLLVGWTGTDYTLLRTDADGYLECVCVGAA
jgi:hypothetical protein